MNTSPSRPSPSPALLTRIQKSSSSKNPRPKPSSSNPTSSITRLLAATQKNPSRSVSKKSPLLPDVLLPPRDSPVGAVEENLQPRFPPAQASEELRGPVRGMVVHHDNLVLGERGFFEDAFQARGGRFVKAVVAHDDDAHLTHLRLSRTVCSLADPPRL